MAREWSAHTPKGKNLPEKVKKAYQDGEENKDESSFLENYIKATAGHKLVDSGLSHLVRRGGLFNNYYANAAREGINAGLTGLDVAPQFRRGFGAVSTSLTGLGDYEAAKALARELQAKIEGATGKKITNINELISHPIAKNYIAGIGKGELSPLTKNIVSALDPNLKSNSAIEMIKRHGGIGADNQKHSGRIGAALSGALGFATGGIPGALGAITSSAPELATASLANRGYTQNIVDLKKGVVGKGVAHGITGSSPLRTAASIGLGAISPFTQEVYSMGQDVGRPIGATVDKPFNIYQKLSRPFNFVPGKARLDQFIDARRNKIKQNLAGKVENALVSPVSQGRIGRWFFRR
jgi:hypothetical protein